MMNNISILGAGESGVGAALLAHAKGLPVFVSDLGAINKKYKEILTGKGIQFEEKYHTEERILQSNLIIKSPGIPDKVDIVKKAIEAGIPVISEIEFASHYTKAKFIAITGSNGKTTTTLFTYHLLKNMGLSVGLAGNVGESLAKQVIEDCKDFYVLELSSFQLDGMVDFKAHISILLNITPDHLDRYDYNFQNYANSKFRILQNMTPADYFIAFIDDETIKGYLEENEILPFTLSVSLNEKVINGAYISDDEIKMNLNNSYSKFFSFHKNNIPLKGKHNMVNAMCSVLVALALNLDESKIMESIKGFVNAPHRLEYVTEINGVDFINDSKATNVDSVFYALDSMTNPVVLIMGGIDKGNDYDSISELVKQKVKALICLGKDNSKLIKYFSGNVPITEASNMDEAVKSSFRLAVKGDVVLLSPACSSFDLFKNYEDRGEQFKDYVLQLSESTTNRNV